ncbi:hypothetical protein [Thermococcus paralvinellae]|uniref:hypothetical protein n=1 Tax=Thermococcus paralvinellae TaxID=582419 RepID=UPI001181CA35|nr:hypothetical protein [Thermococcus paralvinellae]
MSVMYKGTWIHPWDFNEEAISKISHYGFTHASLAIRYIEERQNWPGPNIIFQNSKKRTYTSEENAVYWIPNKERYSHLPPN